MPILFALFLAIFVSQVSVNAAEKIRIGFNPGASGIYFPLAQKKGFFKEEGIEAEVIRLSGGVAVAAAGQRRRRLLHGPFFATGSGLRPSH
jgi:ABC-type nitrate/sulfonate/bicarbonate transport system substrate-binding protein